MYIPRFFSTGIIQGIIFCKLLRDIAWITLNITFYHEVYILLPCVINAYKYSYHIVMVLQSYFQWGLSRLLLNINALFTSMTISLIAVEKNHWIIRYYLLKYIALHICPVTCIFLYKVYTFYLNYCQYYHFSQFFIF